MNRVSYAVEMTFGRQKFYARAKSSLIASTILAMALTFHPWGKSARRYGNGWWTPNGIAIALIREVERSERETA